MKILNIDNDKQSLNNVEVGENVKIYNFVNAYGCKIGDNSKIGAFVEIQKGAVIGKNCKISSHTFICDGVSIGDNCFIGHSVVFINDNYPRSVNEKGELESEEDWSGRFKTTHIGNNVSIGSNATILSGIRIEDNCIIGAGSVVTKNVPENSIVAGVPAKILRKK